MPVSEKLTVDSPEMKKVGVTYENQPYLFQLDVTKSLDLIIKDICNYYQLSKNWNDYALQFNQPTTHNYITETNRGEIENGTIMKLTLSPAKTADAVISALSSSDEQRKIMMLKQLTEHSLDETFAREFQTKQGYGCIADAIQDPSSSGNILSLLLKSFLQLMDHGIAPWNFLCQKFIKKIAGYIIPTKVVDLVTLQCVLEILESIIINCPEKLSIIEHEISLTNVFAHLQNSNVEIQKDTIALINAFFLRGDNAKKKTISEQIQSKNVRNAICNSILNKPQESLSNDMKHQIYLLQTNIFNLLDIVQNMPADINDAAIMANIQDLRQLAFDMDADMQIPVGAKRASNSKDFKKLGFQNTTNPVEDFLQAPPGILALQNMVYFARNHRENYTKVVLENSRRDDGHDLPFAHASVELTRLIADILKIADTPVDDGLSFHYMFFTQEFAFEEFFCTCIQLLNKTWKEMKAMTADFNKVFGVVQEQIVRALDTQPTSFDQFRNKLSKLTYQEIVQIWKKEQKIKDEWDQQVIPIMELREMIRPEIVELIRQQRLKFVINGSKFTTKGTKRQDKHVSIYMRLSQNHKFFHYGEYDENNVPSVEQLHNKIPFDEIKDVYFGKDCPHVRDIKKKVSSNLALTICPLESAANERNEPLNLFAPNEITLNIWNDAFSILFGKEMSSEEFKQDLGILIDMQMKLRLLDIEGIDIPNNIPPIPQDPPNYNF